MNRLDREIMKEILAKEQSGYSINEVLKKKGEKSNYATVWRHIQKMKSENLLYVESALRKNGKIDKRNTEILNLTSKGMATLLIEGDLQEEELYPIGQKIFRKYLGEKLLTQINPFLAGIFSDAMLKIKPRVNLKFFEKNYFEELFVGSLLEEVSVTLSRNNLKIDQKELQKLLVRSRKIAQEEGTGQAFEMGLELGKSLRLKKEKGD